MVGIQLRCAFCAAQTQIARAHEDVRVADIHQRDVNLADIGNVETINGASGGEQRACGSAGRVGEINEYSCSRSGNARDRIGSLFDGTPIFYGDLNRQYPRKIGVEHAHFGHRLTGRDISFVYRESSNRRTYVAAQAQPVDFGMRNLDLSERVGEMRVGRPRLCRTDRADDREFAGQGIGAAKFRRSGDDPATRRRKGPYGSVQLRRSEGRLPSEKRPCWCRRA